MKPITCLSVALGILLVYSQSSQFAHCQQKANSEAVAAIKALAPAKDKTITVARPTQQRLDQIAERGRNLYDYDKFCIIATDALLARLKPDNEKFNYYVAAKGADGWHLYFGKLNESKTEFAIWYEVAYTGSAPQVTAFETAKLDSGDILSRVRAVAACFPLTRRTARTMNYAVLPASAGNVFVYFYPGTNEANTYLLGGDVRYLVSSSDGKVLETRQLHKSIIPWPRPSDLPKGAEETAGFHSAIMDDVPEDTDVFHVLLRRPQCPEYVGTRNWIYNIANNGSIRIVQEAPKPEVQTQAKNSNATAKPPIKSTRR